MWTHEWTGDLSCALGSIASGADHDGGKGKGKAEGKGTK